MVYLNERQRLRSETTQKYNSVPQIPTVLGRITFKDISLPVKSEVLEALSQGNCK